MSKYKIGDIVRCRYTFDPTATSSRESIYTCIGAIKSIMSDCWVGIKITSVEHFATRDSVESVVKDLDSRLKSGKLTDFHVNEVERLSPIELLLWETGASD